MTPTKQGQLVELYDAVKLCRAVEPALQTIGLHIALTGGCLYKPAPRKDIDVLIYQHHGHPLPTFEVFCLAIATAGVQVSAVHRNVVKGVWRGCSVDFILRGGVQWPEALKQKDGES